MLLGVALGVVLAGCQSLPEDEADRVETRAWNSPSGWENSMIGIPY
jgi:hypothetical protein